MSIELERKLFTENVRLRDQLDELIAILEKIADLHRGPGSALAQSALDTMRLLDKQS